MNRRFKVVAVMVCIANIIIRIRGAAVCYSPELYCHFPADPALDAIQRLDTLNGQSAME